MIIEKRCDVFKNGSIWVKADFHLHTRSDKQFTYVDNINFFARDYVTKLKDESISVGVIANHNKFNKEEFYELNKMAKKEDIFLLPGVELSISDGSGGLHILIVFSEEWLANGKNFIRTFLDKVFPGKDASEYENEDANSQKNLDNVVRELNTFGKDYFIIFAHVEDAKGLWNEWKGGRIKDLSEKGYKHVRDKILGFQKVRTRDLRNKVKLWLKDWYPAEVEGSDCKSIAEIGSKKQESWIKIGEYTFEAVKYALYDYPNRLQKEKPERYKHSYIKSVSFEGGILDGQTVNLSPELNTLIGIRGSGKSAIIESIRYAIDIKFGEKTVDKTYKESLIGYALGSGGVVTIVAVDSMGSEYTIKRIRGERTQVFFKGKLLSQLSIDQTIIRNPLYFGQRDLSASGEGFENDLIEKLMGNKLNEIRQKIENQKHTVSDIIYKLKRLDTVDETIEEQRKLKADAEYNLKKIEELGIKDKLSKETNYSVDLRKIKQIIKDVDSFQEDFEDLLSRHEDSIRGHLNYISTENKDFFKELLMVHQNIVTLLNQQVDVLQELAKQKHHLVDKLNEFEILQEAFIDEFAEIRRNVEAQILERSGTPINIENYPDLKKKIDTATYSIEMLEKQKELKSTYQENLKQSLDELNQLWWLEFKMIKKELDFINDKDSSLTIEAQFKGDKDAFLDYVRAVFRGSGLRETTFANLTASFSDFIAMYLDLGSIEVLNDGQNVTFAKFFGQNLDALLSFQVPNKYTIKYRGKELIHHSLGQRASALILFVLNQETNDVIIVDQPEDDLDNQTIYADVIKLLKKIKKRTQFIFATHNANFPVLGDAEQIYACEYRDAKVNLKSGSIDSPFIQKEIVSIMEGGKEAFNKRKEVYKLWTV